MNIKKAKQQVKDTIEAYLACDEQGQPLLPVEKQRPIFLVGAPGIGKTAIMAQIAAELDLGLVSYSMTHHTRQSALGLPFIVEREYGGYSYEASEYTMSEIVASVFDCMRASGRERGILFLDEINCVSETLYPSMLQFLQFKTFGRHQVPQGWVVVTAGNPPEYNRSVHEFDVVTLDRVKKLAVEPDYEAWRSYAADRGVHPAVLTFLDVKKDRFYRVEQTLEGKAFVTARGWDDLSDIIQVYERLGKAVDRDLIGHYVQVPAIAAEFSTYYELFNKYRDDYRVDEILAGCAPAEVLQRAQEAAFDERLSLVGLLLDALVSQQAAVMERTDLLLRLRDDLRALKATVLEDGCPAAPLLEELQAARTRELETLAASGGASGAKRQLIRRELEQLGVYAEALAAAGSAPSEQLACLEAAFAAQADTSSQVAAIEQQLSAAFSFLEEAFGDAQEMLVFTTELTQRTASARYVAQYGSASYYQHNEAMILSDRQRDLRRRIEELDEL
ncbi:MAG: ATP-binding protein [Coriobacteriales bacterium]